jgi:hypothetical protein
LNRIVMRRLFKSRYQYGMRRHETVCILLIIQLAAFCAGCSSSPRWPTTLDASQFTAKTAAVSTEDDGTIAIAINSVDVVSGGVLVYLQFTGEAEPSRAYGLSYRMTYHEDAPIRVVVESEAGKPIQLRPARRPMRLLPTIEFGAPPGVALGQFDDRLVYVQLVALRTHGTLRSGRYRAHLEMRQALTHIAVDTRWVEFTK